MSLLFSLLLLTVLNASSDIKRPHLGICITGQLGRLEIESKIEKLLIPNLSNFEISVVLVLDDRNKSIFANEEKLNSNIAKVSLESARASFQAASTRVFIDGSPQPKNPLIDVGVGSYASSLVKDGGSKIMNKRKIRRAAIHVRQWAALTRCAELLFVRNDRPERVHYDVIMRLRDDSYVVAPFTPQAGEYKGVVVTPDCCEHYGMNDKLAVMGGDVAFTFFNTNQN